MRQKMGRHGLPGLLPAGALFPLQNLTVTPPTTRVGARTTINSS